jgi:hypothetical protein
VSRLANDFITVYAGPLWILHSHAGKNTNPVTGYQTEPETSSAREAAEA